MALLDILNENYKTVYTSMKIIEVAELMAKKNVGSVIVLTDQEFIAGIVTDRDIVTYFAKEGKLHPDVKVEKVMSQNVITCNAGDGIAETIGLMQEHQIRRIPVVSSANKVIGIVTASDLLNLLGEELYALSQIKGVRNILGRRSGVFNEDDNYLEAANF